MKSSNNGFQHRSDRGFTLIELLVAISVMLILAALIFPVLSSAKNRSRQAVCASNVGQISKAVLMYVDDSNGWPIHAAYVEDWAYQVAPYYGKPSSILCPRFSIDGESEIFLRDHSLPGYAMNGCLIVEPLTNRDQQMRENAITVMVAESAIVRCNDPGDRSVELDDVLVEPPSFSGHRPTCEYDEPRGDERHNGGANYGFADGHLKWHRPEDFRLATGPPGTVDPCEPKLTKGPENGPRYFTKWR